MSNAAYINSTGSFLPGPAISSDDTVKFLGPISKVQDRLRKAALAKNGIRHRHYALQADGTPSFTNAEMAAMAVRDALDKSELARGDVAMLCAAASQGDLMAPGIASMVHGALGFGEMDLSSFTSFCASGMMAIKNASAAIRCGDVSNAVVSASEFASRFFREGYLKGSRPSQDTEFLRWTLSDGAGAMVLENRPNEHGQSLRIEWVDLVSHAGDFETCMFGGSQKGDSGAMTLPWSNYPTLHDAISDGSFHLRQDFKLLEEIIPLGLQKYIRLVEDGKIDPEMIDYFLCHFSSDHFRNDLFAAAERIGAPLDSAKIYTNLYERGNTGSASIFIMLNDLLREKDLRDGQQILCMVPESGRFIISYMLLTVVGNSRAEPAHATERKSEALSVRDKTSDPVKASLARRLTDTWIEFERDLKRVPFLHKLNSGALRLEDYKMMLRNHRQQVVEGGRWIARAASSISSEHGDLRSVFIGHAATEHRDYKMLEKDYVAVGGTLDEIQNHPKNIGTEALSAWMFHRAGHENPIDLFGAMFIIEGLGNRLAGHWGREIQRQLQLKPEQVSFLMYHADEDEGHIDTMWQVIDSLDINPDTADAIVKTAKVTARLYRLQLEELDVI